MTDHVKNQLCQRIEELEKEKLELNEQVDALQKERDSLARLKAQWQAEALQELYNTWKGEGMMRNGALLDKAIELQEEAEEGE